MKLTGGWWLVDFSPAVQACWQKLKQCSSAPAPSHRWALSIVFPCSIIHTHNLHWLPPAASHTDCCPCPTENFQLLSLSLRHTQLYTFSSSVLSSDWLTVENVQSSKFMWRPTKNFSAVPWHPTQLYLLSLDTLCSGAQPTLNEAFLACSGHHLLSLN